MTEPLLRDNELVERLRRNAAPWSRKKMGNHLLLAQAADEIVALRLALSALVEMRDKHYEVYGYEKQHYLIDENAQWARARKALSGVPRS